jgi:anaerobic selenocysteine-containing dehydrogenase
MAERALGKVGLVAYLTTTLNTGHAWGRGRETIVLPVLPRDEEPQPTTQESMFSFVRLSDGGPTRYPGPRSEVSILAELGRRVLPPQTSLDWGRLQSHEAIRQLIAATIPGLEGIGRIGETREEFSIPGRYLDQPRFPTPNGRARFQAVGLPRPEPLGPRQLRMMTIRSEGQFNTVVYDDDDLYRGQERRDVILMHPTEIARLGLVPDQPVRVRSAVGELRYQRVRPFDVRPGNAMMYCPESNGLISRAVDPESKTPAFKHVVVEIDPE